MRVRGGPKFWLFMIVSTIIVFSISLGVFTFMYRRNARELERIHEYRDTLDLKVRDLESELEYARTDAFIIETARDKLGLIMPNEIRYVNSAN